MKKEAVKKNYYVAIAEYDAGGSDGLVIDNVVPFDNPDDAAKFIVDDYNDSMLSYVESGVLGKMKYLTLTAVKKKVKKLNIGESDYWYAPSEIGMELQWKVFVK